MRTIIKISFLVSICFLLTSCARISGIKADLTQMLFNLQSSLQPIWQFLIAFSYVAGICFVVLGIMKLKTYGQMTVMMATHANLGPAMAYFFVGIGLLFLPNLLDVMTVSLWGYDVNSIVGYNEIGGNFSDVMVPISQLIQVIGLISFLRGWIMLVRLGHQGGQPGTLGKGLIHMLGGILAINITGTISILRASFGLG
jgi:intracellular multiplication protein IcmC